MTGPVGPKGDQVRQYQSNYLYQTAFVLQKDFGCLTFSRFFLALVLQTMFSEIQLYL